MASFFSGLVAQGQGLIAEKMGKGPTEGEVPPEGGEVPLEGAENGEVPPEGGAMGSAMGFMGGIMQKANAVKGAVAEKAGGLGAGNLQAFGGSGGAEGEVPLEGQEGYVEGQEGVEGEAPASMGFAAGLMMKAHSLKEGVKEKGANINLGNVQGMTSMAGGVMGQVQGLIPGMKREEDVPDPAPPAEGEYAEYTEEQYAEQGYTEEQYTE